MWIENLLSLIFEKFRQINFFFNYRVISEAKHVSQFPNLNGTNSLQVIRFDRANIREITQAVCHHSPHLKSL